MYYWDGARWTPTLSPDGRFRWNGTVWEPVPVSTYAPAYYGAPARQREPTSWTRPLQLAVAGWFLVRGLYELTLPFWMGPLMNQVVQASLQRQEANYPPGTAPPPGFADMMNSIMVGSLWFGVLLGVALSVVAIAGALWRWTWAYYAVLVLLGFGLLGAVTNSIDLVTGGALTTASPVAIPGWTRVFSLVFSAVDAALFVVMLVALIRRGPWAMRRVS